MHAAPVRRASADDATAVGRLLHAFNSEYGDWTPGPEAVAAHARRLLEAGEVIVLLAGEGPDGLAQVRLRTSIWTGMPDAYVEELYVAPDRRGQGTGRALLEAAMRTAREEGATHIDVTTSEDDTAALGLYESAGFTNREGRPDGPVMLYWEREL
jgi:ribosomal protein S18 acetylase RimI-like enzyme